jgi:hypothetical protein
MRFLIDHKTKTVQVSVFESNDVIIQATNSAKAHGYDLIMVITRVSTPIRKVA